MDTSGPKLKIVCDGGCRLTHPDKIGSYGYVIIYEDKVIRSGSGLMFHTSNNRCEYQAVIEALKDFPKNEPNLEIVSDSQLLINQLKCKWKVNDTELQRLRLEVFRLLGEMFPMGGNITFTWAPRESKWNAYCDKLCNQKMDEYLKENS